MPEREFTLGRGRESWAPVSDSPDHPLAALEGKPLAGGRLLVTLGPHSRFGARYFRLLVEGPAGTAADEPVLIGLHNTGPYPSYNWVEVAATKERLTMAGSDFEIGLQGIERLFQLLFELLPPGGHLMVEYDSPERAETATGLAHGVPAIATPLGEQLFRIGFGAYFKDWQIAEGGAEGPRKLQAYKPAAEADVQRWRSAATRELQAFLTGQAPSSDVVSKARERGKALLSGLSKADGAVSS